MSRKWICVLVFTALLLGTLGLPAQAAQPKTYQVTGPVLELTNDTITVKKGSEKWEIGRDAATKVTGDLKVGATVTIQYRMSAASIDVKGGAKADKADKGAAKTDKADKGAKSDKPAKTDKGATKKKDKGSKG